MIRSAGIGVLSDERHKTNIEKPNTNELLNKICLTPISIYNFIDKTKTNNKQYGFIAQELKHQFPELISYMKDVIPNIYKICNTTKLDNTIVLNIEHNLDLSEVKKIKIISKDISNGIIVDIKTFTDNSIIIYLFDKYIENETLFIYGCEIDDFHNIDITQLTSLSIGGIQELSKQVDKLKSENNDLRIRLEKLETLLQVKP